VPRSIGAGPRSYSERKSASEPSHHRGGVAAKRSATRPPTHATRGSANGATMRSSQPDAAACRRR
jgi:hypothetical protein